MGVDELGVAKMGVDEMGSRRSGMTPIEHFDITMLFIGQLNSNQHNQTN